MYKILFASLALLLTAACAGDPIVEEVADTTEAIAEVAETPIPAKPVLTEEVSAEPVDPSEDSLPEGEVPLESPAENLYVSEQFGFQFNYPAGYVIVGQGEEAGGGFVSMMREEDVNEPEPLSISIVITENPEQLSLETFRDELLGLLVLEKYPNRTVANQPALDFEAGGLYETRSVVFSTPDGESVISMGANYLGQPSEDDAMWLAAQEILDSLAWRGSETVAE